MKKMLTALVITSFLTMGVAHAEKVCKITDGDTLQFCSGRKVQLHGINAPEEHQPFGIEARNQLKELIMDKDVEVTGCRERGMLRDMCSISLNGKDIQAEMVRMGYAFDFPKYSSGKYAQDQSDARQSRKGMWIQSEGNLESWDIYHKERR